MNLIDLAEDRDQWRALVNAVMKLRVPYILEYLSDWRILKKEWS
jgi:hypothetical protein